MGIVHRDDPAVTDCGSADIGPEILDRCGTGPEWLNVDTPFFGPDNGIDLPAESIEVLAKLRPECFIQNWNGDKEVIVFHPDIST